ncbi:hypothetical protein C451_19968 [Halococcus thailandensis JCM 13552]|uniref:Uncharacterized protein n=1 Tax=Halococcus thailandensis JCM 13552 TaxID=1227457 RepID=M0MSH2_9EURY|nr:hypothetical protein C451_19968 [Halococcus thailandensis JCM 13552]
MLETNATTVWRCMYEIKSPTKRAIFGACLLITSKPAKSRRQTHESLPFLQHFIIPSALLN